MKLVIFKEDSLDLLKHDIYKNIENYAEVNNKWIEKYQKELFQKFGGGIKKIKLNMSYDKPEQSDVENIKMFYNNLKFLSDSQASEERLWAALCHTHFWDYMQYRWPFSKARNSKEKFIRKNYFYAHGLTRSLMTNALARLWWLGRLTYDETRENPYAILEYLGSDLNGKGFPLFGTNYSNNKKILRDIFDALFEFEKSNGKLSRIEFQVLVKELNLWGGGTSLDYLCRGGLLKNKVAKYLSELKR